jgi:alpha-ribazole phosphatase
MDDLVAVTLLRHGVTQANLERRYLGWTDPPLTDKAIINLQHNQAFGAAFDYCATSDLLRARQTARILCPHLDIMQAAAFREMNFGQWEMKTYGDLRNNPSYRAWIDDAGSITPPDGESFSEMAGRVEIGFDKLRQEAIQHRKKNILLVAHGGVIRYLLTALTEEKKQFFEWKVAHDRAIQLIWRKEDWKEAGTCISLQEVPLMGKADG